MTGYLNDFINGNPTEYVPGKKLLDMGVDAVAPFDIPAQDRNPPPGNGICQQA